MGHLSLKERRSWQWVAMLASSAAVLVAGCRSEVEVPASEIRPVRAVTVHKRESAVPIILTGSIRARDEVPLAFRISGRMIERPVNLGDPVRATTCPARLEPQNEQNALRSALANLAA